jgi:hypothetical protein
MANVILVMNKMMKNESAPILVLTSSSDRAPLGKKKVYYETIDSFESHIMVSYILYETVNGFVQKIRNYRKFSTGCTKLLEGFIVKPWNPLQFSELKKVLYGNYKTIFTPRNLKLFRKQYKTFKLR